MVVISIRPMLKMIKIVNAVLCASCKDDLTGSHDYFVGIVVTHNRLYYSGF